MAISTGVVVGGLAAAVGVGYVLMSKKAGATSGADLNRMPSQAAEAIGFASGDFDVVPVTMTDPMTVSLAPHPRPGMEKPFPPPSFWAWLAEFAGKRGMFIIAHNNGTFQAVLTETAARQITGTKSNPSPNSVIMIAPGDDL